MSQIVTSFIFMAILVIMGLVGFQAHKKITATELKFQEFETYIRCVDKHDKGLCGYIMEK